MVDLLLQHAVPLLMGIGIVSAVVAWIVKLFKEIGEAFTVISVALSDDKISTEEIASIIKEAKDVIDAAKEIKNIKK